MSTILNLVQEIYWVGTDDNRLKLTLLANYALSKIGGAGESVGDYRIQNIDDTTNKTAVAMLEIWPQVRKEVLCRAWWTSATKYADLGAEVDVERANWKYAFNLPSDYLGKVMQLWQDYHSSTKHKYISTVDKEVVQGRLFTNTLTNSDGDSAYIKYVFDLDIVSKFDSLLTEAISNKWAAEMATRLRADGGKRRAELLEEYEKLVLDVADGIDASQTGDDDYKGAYSALDVRDTFGYIQ